MAAGILRVEYQGVISVEIKNLMMKDATPFEKGHNQGWKLLDLITIQALEK